MIHKLTLLSIFFGISCTPSVSVPAGTENLENSNNNTDNNNANTDVVQNSAPVNFIVNEAYEASAIGSDFLTPPEFWAIVEVEITNTSLERVNFGRTDFSSVNAGVAVRAEEKDLDLGSQCPRAVSLDSGSTLNCQLGFKIRDIPESFRLTLRFSKAAEAETREFQFRSCDRCGTDRCRDLKTDQDHCGACSHSVAPWGRCKDGQIECVRDSFIVCNGVCVSQTTDDNCGGCGVTCDDVLGPQPHETHSGCAQTKIIPGKLATCFTREYSPNSVSCNEQCEKHGSVCLDAQNSDVESKGILTYYQTNNIWSVPCDGKSETYTDSSYFLCSCTQ